MALDGIVISNLVCELQETLIGGRINKIAQPEKDELLLTIKNNREQHRLLISAGASLPLIYLTKENKPSPLTAPNFCMLLRKHLNSAKILDISQPEMERIIEFKIEHLNELGDICIKYLIVELMGKHSNIIFCDNKKVIIDSIKHISGLVSSVREVLPGRNYFIAKTQEKENPLTITYERFKDFVLTKPTTLSKAIYTSLTGISPLIANEICVRASLDSGNSTSTVNEIEGLHLYKTLTRFMEDISECNFDPIIIYDKRNKEPIEFSSTLLTCYQDFQVEHHDSISEVLESYYSLKNIVTRIRQKSSDLRRIVSTATERTRKKYDLQCKQLKDTEKREKYKIYGELLTTYGYQAEPGAKSLTCENYYTNQEIRIPLDDTISAMENAKKYFDRYGKLKRTFEALSVQIKETKEEIEHLESISAALDIALEEDDLIEVKKELIQYGYIKKHGVNGKKEKKHKNTSKPFHYISSDGFHMYVGKNNYQNEELTFKFANGNDWWFHAKGMAGSHVVVKMEGAKELPDRTFEEAGMLAGFYSKGRNMDKVEIDYVERKHVKKPNNGKPGFVIYHTNYSLTIKPDISGLVEIS
ncbi:Rqc2 family fibronectin-binding protein [Velocimicrobium porci]|uniref:Rqc2 homolog RqcH n=1 Tax=Velocimicrobium porci TaxID=2606634 RepID=A0A6L5XX82_9FIRM|nr:NFACT RNA binding domain-containing protein [Velocimicrobium porci]MSS63071.1 fibronectin/fibrinogen-binding protein [Velocimicrobium porci]